MSKPSANSTPYEQLLDSQESLIFQKIGDFWNELAEATDVKEPVRWLTRKIVNLYGYNASVVVARKLKKERR